MKPQQTYGTRAEYRLAEHLTELVQAGVVNSDNQHYRNLMNRINHQESTVEFKQAVADNEKILAADAAQSDRKHLDDLITEYQTLSAMDRDADAGRRWQIRDEVGTLSHLMGPAESSRWTDTLAGPYETVAEAVADTERERQLGEKAIEDLAQGRTVDPAVMEHLPLDGPERIKLRRNEIAAEKAAAKDPMPEKVAATSREAVRRKQREAVEARAASQQVQQHDNGMCL